MEGTSECDVKRKRLATLMCPRAWKGRLGHVHKAQEDRCVLGLHATTRRRDTRETHELMSVNFVTGSVRSDALGSDKNEDGLQS